MPEVLAVMPAAPAEDRALVRGRLKLRVGERCGNCRAVFGFETARVGCKAAPQETRERVVDLESLRTEAPAPFRPSRPPCSALAGAVPKTHGPLRRDRAMVGAFLDRLGGEVAKELVGRSTQLLQQHVLPCRIKQPPRDRLRKVAVG